MNIASRKQLASARAAGKALPPKSRASMEPSTRIGADSGSQFTQNRQLSGRPLNLQGHSHGFLQHKISGGF